MSNYVLFFALLYLVIIMAACGKPHDGAQGSTGAQGPTGAQGVPGVIGPTGPAGTNATPVTVVPLCPGFVPTYPNIFPEYALCIQSKLYGVYSANGGFLAELPPGTYSSNGINADCHLTILPNCVVQ